jgi:hypothetical protein
VLRCSDIGTGYEYSDTYYKGFNLPLSRHNFSRGYLTQSLQELRAIGVNTLFIVTSFYQQAPNSSTIYESSSMSIGDTDLELAIDEIVAAGITPILKPHINVTDQTPRYMISPDTTEKWQKEYHTILYRYAEISQRNNLPALVIGTELDMVADTRWFSALIDSVRVRFSGTIIYSASYDHFWATALWNKVDIMGVNAYYQLCGKEYCNLSTYLQSWAYWLSLIEETAVKRDKPVIISETGFTSTTKTAINPGDWNMSEQIAMIEQEKAYTALLSQAPAYSSIQGIFFWEWDIASYGGEETGSYTPRNKPAEEVVHEYWN